MEQFTFYEWYADILQSMDDISAGKLANCICAYEFEDREPMEQLSDKEDFYWSNIAGILKEVKETESIGKIPKKYNLQSKHFTFYETYYKAMKLMNTRKQGIFVKAICAYMFENEEHRSLRMGRCKDILLCANGSWMFPRNERAVGKGAVRRKRKLTQYL